MSDDTPRTTGSRPTTLRVMLAFGAVALLVFSVARLTLMGPAGTPEAFASGPATLAAALEAASSENRLVVAVATADWCGPCQSYKRGALADDRVAEWMSERAVGVLVDVTDGLTPEAQRLGVDPIPATFVMNAEGRVLDTVVGSIGADELIELLEGAAARAEREG